MEAIEQAVRWGLSNAVLAVALAVLACSASRLVRRPALTHALWILVMLKLVSPPLWPLELPAREQAAVERTAGDVAASQAAIAAMFERPDAVVQITPIERDTAAWQSDRSRAGLTAIVREHWQAIVLSLWVGGSLVALARTLAHIQKMRRLLWLTEGAPESAQHLLGRVVKRSGLRRVPDLRVVHERISPMVWAVGRRAIILLPAELLGKLTESQRTTLLAHEVAHLRRGDHWVRRLEVAAAILYWWHPVVWWARREIGRAEEQCCDGCVAAWFPEYVREYGRVLLDTVDFLSEARGSRPLLASGFASERFLGKRLEAMMNGKFQARLSWAGRLGVVMVALAALPLFAQTGEKPHENGGQSEVQAATQGARDAGGVVEFTPIEVDRTSGAADVEARLAALERLVGELARELRADRKPKDTKSAADKEEHRRLHEHRRMLLVPPLPAETTRRVYMRRTAEKPPPQPEQVLLRLAIIEDSSGSLSEFKALRGEATAMIAPSDAVSGIIQILRKNGLCTISAEPHLVTVMGRPATMLIEADTNGRQRLSIEVTPKKPQMLEWPAVQLGLSIELGSEDKTPQPRFVADFETTPGHTIVLKLFPGMTEAKQSYLAISPEPFEGAVPQGASREKAQSAR